jgi:hypothetical protein
MSRSQSSVVTVLACLFLACPGLASGGRSLTEPAPARAAFATTSPMEIAGVFLSRSYAPGAWARLRVTARATRLTLQVFECGPGRSRKNLYRAAVTQPLSLRWSTTGSTRTLTIKVRSWPSGLYFARLLAPDGRRGYAPFVLRARPLGSARVAIFLPTNTWQAYNFRDMNHDGVGDTWYADASIHTVYLTRPYLRGGMPPRFRAYDLGFLHWFATSVASLRVSSLARKMADFYADDDFVRFTSGSWLASRYDLIVFSGHEEYVTGREYDLTQSYRNHGGNLAFLSANNFFYKVIKSGGRLNGRWRWRDLGRPEAALVGVQYLDRYRKPYDLDPYVVTGPRTAPWLFAGTGLSNGDRFGNFGIEIDHRTTASPRTAILLAHAPKIFGPGETAEMTYYTTSRHAKVFAAGVLNFGGSTRRATVSSLLQNLWAELSVP